jgi:hypothetical protein
MAILKAKFYQYHVNKELYAASVVFPLFYLTPAGAYTADFLFRGLVYIETTPP